MGCFAAECLRVIERGAKGALTIKGNRLYKKIAGVPLHPAAASETCNRCGLCVGKCPVSVISADETYKTDGSLCISCGHCIMVCPERASKYPGLKYKLIEAIFKSSFSKRKEPDLTAGTLTTTQHDAERH